GQVLRQCDGFRMGVRVDGEAADVAEVGLLHIALPARIELAHGDELAVDEEWNVVEHGMNAMLDDRGSFFGLAAVDVHDVYRLYLLEQLLGTHRGEHVG